MELFQWKNQYSLDIKFIDDQHRSLVRIIAELRRNLLKGTPADITEDALSSLVDYTIYHFSNEEELFVLYNYPDFQTHKKQHDELTRQILHVQNNIKNKSATLSHELMDFLINWLENHILNEDKKFGMYLKSHNITIE